jgi:hypothetical protein
MLETLRMVVTHSKTSACVPLHLVLWVHSLSGHIACLTLSIYVKLGELINTRPEGTSFNIESAGNNECVVRLATLFWFLVSK